MYAVGKILCILQLGCKRCLKNNERHFNFGSRLATYSVESMFSGHHMLKVHFDIGDNKDIGNTCTFLF